jgi:photosystem II stability/assembly factor-like uncharacterized protein
MKGIEVMRIDSHFGGCISPGNTPRTTLKGACSPPWRHAGFSGAVLIRFPAAVTWAAVILFVLTCHPARAQWTQTSFPQNQTVLSMAVKSGIIFAGTPNSGMFASSDSGRTWTTRNNGLPLGSSRAMVVHRGSIFTGGGACVYRTTDNGLSWTARNIPASSSIVVNALAADSADIFAGTSNGIFRSSNDGVTWIDINPWWGYTWISSIAVVDSIILAGGGFPANGLYRSTNRGTSWDGRIDTIPAFNIMRTLLIVDSTAFAGVDMGSFSGGIFRSSDLGVTWAGRDSGSLFTRDIRCFAYAGNTLFAGGDPINALYASNDFGRTVRSIATGLPSNVQALAVLDTLLFAAPSGGTAGIWKRPLSQIVPVTLSRLSARWEDGLEKLEWRTESEASTQGFEIQRREAPREEWIPIGFVHAKGSNTGSALYEYAFRPETSPAPGCPIQLRLKIIDFDGSFEYSPQVDLAIETGAVDFQFHASYPNPADKRSVLAFSLSRGARVRLTVVNMLGMAVRTVVDGDLGVGWYMYPVDTSELQRGMYHCILKAGNREAVRTMIVE